VCESARVVRWDQRGCGRSGPTTAHSVARYVADLETIRKSYGFERWVVGGHSWGAGLALQYALRHRDRTRALLYISGTGIGRAWNAVYHTEADRRRSTGDLARLQALEQRSRTTVEEHEFRRLRWTPDFASSEAATELIPQLDAPFAINLEANRRINRETKAWVEADLAAQCRNMDAPALVVHGACDPRPAWAVDSLVAALPDASVEILPDAGHLPWLETPAAFARCVQRFLAEVHAD
jgi:proline iminopeptidase